MPFRTVSSAPYTPRTTNDSTGHNNAVSPYAAAINSHTHDPSDTIGNYGNSVPAWGASNPLYSLHGPGGAGIGNDWGSAYNGSAAIPADPTETAINPANNTTLAQTTPGASITAAWGIHGELARIRGAIALLKGATANWFDAVTMYSDPTTTAGDIAYRNASNVSSRLGAGTAAQVLTIVGGVPAWATSPAGFADPETTPGDMIYHNGSSVTTRLPIGANGSLLQVVSGLPTWQSTSSVAIPSITNGSGVVTVNTDGSVSSTAGAAALGTLQTNVSSQFIAGNNVRGYVRLVISGTAVAAGATVAIVNFSAALASVPFVEITPIASTGAVYGGGGATVAASNAFVVSNPTTAGFAIVCPSGLSASTNYAFVFHVWL